MTVIYLTDPAGVLTGPVTLPVVPGMGVQLPGNAIELADELATPEAGYVLTLIDGEVVVVADYRGPVFMTATGDQEEWSALGQLPDGYTIEPKPGPFHVWLDGGWQLDQAALTASKTAEVQALRDERLRMAALRIAPLQDAHDLGESTETEEALLLSWKRYRIALNRIEQQAGYAVAVDWPLPPGAEQPE